MEEDDIGQDNGGYVTQLSRCVGISAEKSPLISLLVMVFAADQACSQKHREPNARAQAKEYVRPEGRI